jgi:hypothetical protein
LEVWWIGPDGSVQDAYYYDFIGYWNRFQLAPAGSANTSSGIGAFSRDPDIMEVWWIPMPIWYDWSIRYAYFDEAGWH